MDYSNFVLPFIFGTVIYLCFSFYWTRFVHEIQERVKLQKEQVRLLNIIIDKMEQMEQITGQPNNQDTTLNEPKQEVDAEINFSNSTHPYDQPTNQPNIKRNDNLTFPIIITIVAILVVVFLYVINSK